MKKSSKNKLKKILLLAVPAGCLWLAYILPLHPLQPTSVTIKVQQPSHNEPTPVVQAESGGEEQITPEESKAPSVIAPVVPENVPPLPTGAHPKIAIVIDDVGVDYKDSETAIKLPPEITLSFLPYAVRLREQVAEARQAGHELILHMPMEPIGHEDPGPGALLVDLPGREKQERFEKALASFTGFDGVNNHMGSKFTADADSMDIVIDELQQRHLFYFDSRTSAKSVGYKIAQEKGLPSISRDVFLDDDQSPAAIRAQLVATEHVANRKGYAVAIGHPHPSTMEVLGPWIDDVRKRGYILVPLNTLVKTPKP